MLVGQLRVGLRCCHVGGSMLKPAATDGIGIRAGCSSAAAIKQTSATDLIAWTCEHGQRK